jgi:hypothetical protein
MATGVVPIYSRLLPPLPVFTTFLSLTLYSMRNSHYTGHYVLSDRATVSLIIQFLFSCLGMALIFIYTLDFNFTTNLYTLKNPITIGQLSLFAALSVPRTDMTLPWRHLSLVILAIVAAQIPSALWAGSLTPILTPVSIPGMIQVPTFTEESKGIWDAQFIYKPDDLGDMERIGYLLEECKSSPSKTRVFSCSAPYLQ